MFFEITQYNVKTKKKTEYYEFRCDKKYIYNNVLNNNKKKKQKTHASPIEYSQFINHKIYIIIL